MDEQGALSGRRALSEEEARDRLRAGLIQRFRDDARYKNIVRQDLSPVWNAANATGLWTGNPPLTFHDVLDRLHDLYEPDAQTTGSPERYVRMLARTVGHTMGLTSHGFPSDWALRSVHDDVIGQPRRSQLLTVSPRISDDDISISFDMTPNFIAARFFGGQGAAETRTLDYDLSHYGVGYGTAHWAALGTTARLVIEQAISDMRDLIDRRYPARNSATVDGWERDLDALFALLFHNERPNVRSMDVRVRRLCKQLDIDSPLSRRSTHLVPYRGPYAAEDPSASVAS